MWPWMHLAFGYIAVSLSWRLGRRRVDGAAAVAVLLGTQFPDLVDKPLAWYLGVLPGGRSLAHSAIIAAAVSVVVLAAAYRWYRLPPAIAFVVAYGSHIAGDALPPLLTGDYGELRFLFWPVLPLSEYSGATPVLESLGEILASPAAYLLGSPLRAAIVAGVVVLWGVDGFPGVAGAGQYLSGRIRARTD